MTLFFVHSALKTAMDGVVKSNFIQVFCKRAGGEKRAMCIHRDMSISDVKTAVRKRFAIPDYTHIEIDLHAAKKFWNFLDDACKVSSYNLEGKLLLIVEKA